jgi:HEAT repeat protein
MRWAGLLAVLLFTTLIACSGVPAAQPQPTTSLPTDTPPLSDLLQLRQSLNGADDVARLTAIAQLQFDGSPEAVTYLGEFFANSDKPGRLESAQALLHINTTQAKNYIRDAMREEQLTARRQVAMQALEANGESAYPFLQELIQDTNETVKLNTLQVIEYIDPTEAQKLLAIATKDSSPVVQKAAADALQELAVPTPQP